MESGERGWVKWDNQGRECQIAIGSIRRYVPALLRSAYGGRNFAGTRTCSCALDSPICSPML